MTTIETILLSISIVLIIAIVALVIILLKRTGNKNQSNTTDAINNQEALKGFAEQISKTLEMQQLKNIEAINAKIDLNTKQNKQDIDEIKKTVTEDLNKSVDTHFARSFNVIKEQLDGMNQAAGEIKQYGSTAQKLLSAMKNVKVSGVFGEAQLSNILDQFLSQGQYVTNFQAKDGQERVEFAIKFPSKDGESVYLPIDSKFPNNVFMDLIEAQKSGSEDLINFKLAQLKTTINNMAKDIHNKYINPPKTTSYAIMFLPTESLYVEVIKLGLMEEIQNKYQVTIAGPTTISAMLISFMMGFKTFKIQQDASNIFTMLSALKAQFSQMEKEIKSIQDGFSKSSKGFDKLVDTRFRMVKSKIKSIDEMPLNESDKLIGVNDQEQIKQIEAEEKNSNEQ